MKFVEQLKSRIGTLAEQYREMESATRVRLGVAVSLVLLVIILFTSANERIAALEMKRKSREADLVEMMSLKQRYLSARLAFQRFAGRLSGAEADDSPAKVIEEIGIKGKSSRVTPLKGGEDEETAEVKIEGLSANEAINLLYRLEKGSRPVLVKKADIKTRFDDPSRLDLTMTIVLVKASPQGEK